MGEVLVRFLNREDVLAVRGDDFRAAIADVRAALALLRDGDAEMPAENSVRLGPVGASHATGLSCPAPARLGGDIAAAGLKWTAHRPPVEDGAPAILGMTIVNDAATGRPIGIVESGLLTTDAGLQRRFPRWLLATCGERSVAARGADWRGSTGGDASADAR